MQDDDKAKIAAAGSAAAGVGGAVAAVSAAGTTAGLSAAGITSGLSAMGGIVGGGMVAGLGVVAAVPILTGAAGYLLYKTLKK